MLDLPRPDPFHLPDSPEQAFSDLLLHGAISAGTYAAVYAYTGLYAGPGHAGILWHAFFSTAEVGAAGASTSAFADTMFALSVYAEPVVAVGRFVSPLVAPVALVVGTAYVAHKIHTDSSWQAKARQWGAGMDFSPHFA